MKLTEIDIDRFRIWRNLLLRIDPKNRHSIGRTRNSLGAERCGVSMAVAHGEFIAALKWRVAVD